MMKTNTTAGTGRLVWEITPAGAAIEAGPAAAIFFVDMFQNSCKFRPIHNQTQSADNLS
jgi:hypothetical protein